MALTESGSWKEKNNHQMRRNRTLDTDALDFIVISNTACCWLASTKGKRRNLSLKCLLHWARAVAGPHARANVASAVRVEPELWSDHVMMI